LVVGTLKDGSKHGMKMHYEEQREDLLARLRRIEGQVRGVQKMIEEGRDCVDVVDQITAFNAAGREVAMMLIESHLRACAAEAADEGERDEIIREVGKALRKLLRL
jgi:CsoR family transcriptional regulator, copper-sensing transcriptional repressor